MILRTRMRQRIFLEWKISKKESHSAILIWNHLKSLSLSQNVREDYKSWLLNCPQVEHSLSDTSETAFAVIKTIASVRFAAFNEIRSHAWEFEIHPFATESRMKFSFTYWYCQQRLNLILEIFDAGEPPLIRFSWLAGWAAHLESI